MTIRAFAIGVLCVLLIGIGTPYSDLVMQGTWIGLTSFPVSALFLLVVIVALVNIPLRRLGWGLSRAELLAIYCMMLVAAGVPSFGLTGLLIPYLAGPFYFASPENKWEETLHPFIPEWWHPESARAINGLYEGLKPGQAVPWKEWLVPLAAWTVLALSVYAVFFALATLLRRRWVDEEKLVFPLVQLPVEMCEQGPQRPATPPFLRRPIVWAGFAVPCLIHLLNGLHHHIPVVPGLNVHLISLDSHLGGRPWSAMAPLWLRLLFSIVALAYLLPQELSFSLFVFFFFFLVQQVIGSAFGWNMPAVQAYPVRQFVAHQMIGGILVFGVGGLWASRALFRDVLRQAIGVRASADKGGSAKAAPEALPYGAALWLGIAGLAVTCWFGGLAGGAAASTFILFALFYVVHIVAVRLVCEGGMLYVQHPFRPLNIMLAAVGSRALGPRPMATLALFDHLFMLDNRSPLMPGIMQSLRIADDGPISRPKLTGALAVAVVIAIGASYWSYLSLMYRHGGSALNTWFTTYYTRNLYSTWTSYLINPGDPATPKAFLTMVAGGASMAAILHLHRTFLWWPLHPIGYLMGASWPMINYWFPVFLGWLCKTTVLWIGGAKLYRRLIPGFLGLILGEFFSAGLWVAIDFVAGVRGHQIFSF